MIKCKKNNKFSLKNSNINTLTFKEKVCIDVDKCAYHPYLRTLYTRTHGVYYTQQTAKTDVFKS